MDIHFRSFFTFKLPTRIFPVRQSSDSPCSSQISETSSSETACVEPNKEKHRNSEAQATASKNRCWIQNKLFSRNASRSKNAQPVQSNKLTIPSPKITLAAYEYLPKINLTNDFELIPSQQKELKYSNGEAIQKPLKEQKIQGETPIADRFMKEKNLIIESRRSRASSINSISSGSTISLYFDSESPTIKGIQQSPAQTSILENTDPLQNAGNNHYYVELPTQSNIIPKTNFPTPSTINLPSPAINAEIDDLYSLVEKYKSNPNEENLRALYYKYDNAYEEYYANEIKNEKTTAMLLEINTFLASLIPQQSPTHYPSSTTEKDPFMSTYIHVEEDTHLQPRENIEIQDAIGLKSRPISSTSLSSILAGYYKKPERIDSSYKFDLD